MKYDFDTIINRKNTGSYKWDEILLEMGAGNDDIIPLSVADMEFKAAPEIVKAIKGKADQSVFGYTGPTEGYYEAVAGWMERRHCWKIKKEWISLSPGVVPALYTAISAFCNSGDRVIIQQPVYYPFSNAIADNGCEILNNPLIYKAGHYTMDFEDLEKKAEDPRTKAIIICNPHNPVGRVWTRDELTELGKICIKNNVLVISDEIHFDFVYEPYKHTVFANISEEFQNNCLIMTAPSKTFNLAGLQCSNVIIPNSKLKEQFDKASEITGFFSLNQFAYTACEAAYTEGEEWLNQVINYIKGNIDYLKEFMTENLPQIPVIKTEGTYLVWLDFRSLGLDNGSLKKLMREKGRVFFDEGTIFGNDGSGFERLNAACPRAMLEKALNNILGAVRKASDNS